MPLTIGMKAQRCLRLLLGLRNPRVANALAFYGFSEKDVEEGWELLQACGRTRFDADVAAPGDVATINALDQWEDKWFPISSAALQRHYPATHARLFLNLSQTEGPEVAMSVRTFLDRFEGMANGEGNYGAEGRKAAELLVRRGMTAAVITEARSLLSTLGKVAPPQVPFSIEEQKAELVRAEDAMWAWYLEWSAMTRVAIKQRSLLKQLGFLTDRGGAEEEPVTEPIEPGPSVPSGIVTNTVSSREGSNTN